MHVIYSSINALGVGVCVLGEPGFIHLNNSFHCLPRSYNTFVIHKYSFISALIVWNVIHLLFNHARFWHTLHAVINPLRLATLIAT